MDTTLNTTDVNVTIRQLQEANYGMFKTMHILHEFVLPVVIVVGIVGNCTSIWVFNHNTLRMSSSSVHLIAVLASDTGFLVSLIWPYLETKGLHLTSQAGWCHVIVYLSYVFGFLSTWFIVSITVENYITICHPTRIKTMCTVPRAKAVVFSMTVVSLVGYSATVIFTKSVDFKCYPESEFVWRVITYCDSVLTLLFPSVILTVLLTSIITTVLKRIHRKLSLNRRNKSSDKRRDAPNSSHMQMRVVKMLFILSVTVFAMTVPSHVVRLRLVVLFIVDDTMTGTVTENFVYRLFLFIYQSSFAIKVFIFLLCSTTFRKVLRNKLSDCCGRLAVMCNAVKTAPTHV